MYGQIYANRMIPLPYNPGLLLSPVSWMPWQIKTGLERPSRIRWQQSGVPPAQLSDLDRYKVTIAFCASDVPCVICVGRRSDGTVNDQANRVVDAPFT